MQVGYLEEEVASLERELKRLKEVIEARKNSSKRQQALSDIPRRLTLLQYVVLRLIAKGERPLGLSRIIKGLWRKGLVVREYRGMYRISERGREFLADIDELLGGGTVGG